MTATLRTDVAVIGAGPAGSCAAIAAARAGARVVLVERARMPRPKACGCCLAERGIARLRALGADDAIADAMPLASLRLKAGGRELVLRREVGIAIGREELDARLLEIARAAGVACLEGHAARIGNDGVVSVGAADVRIAAETTIVADGLAGTSLDEVPGFAWITARRSLMGFGAVLPGDALEVAPREIAMHVGRGGYLGLVRLPDGRIDVAAAASPDFLRASGGVAGCARALLADLPRRNERTLDEARWKGTPLLTRRRTRIAAPGLLVVGDAAGYVEPFTGEGMSWAIETGSLAGELAARAPERWRAWPSIHRAACARSRLRCRAIAICLRSPTLVASLMALARRAPRPFERLAAGIGAEIPA